MKQPTTTTGTEKVRKTGPKSKRHATIKKIYGINKPTCERICRRSGVSRSSAVKIQPICNDMLKDFLHTIVREAIQFTVIRGKKTITPADLNASLERYGRAVHGTI